MRKLLFTLALLALTAVPAHANNFFSLTTGLNETVVVPTCQPSFGFFAVQPRVAVFNSGFFAPTFVSSGFAFSGGAAAVVSERGFFGRRSNVSVVAGGGGASAVVTERRGLFGRRSRTIAVAAGR